MSAPICNSRRPQPVAIPSRQTLQKRMARLRGTQRPWFWWSLMPATRRALVIPTLTKALCWSRVNSSKNIASAMMRWTPMSCSAHAALAAELWQRRNCGNCTLSGRYRALGFEGEIARATVGKFTRHLPRFRAGLRIRRIHFLRRQPVAGATRRLGGAGHSAREDEDRNASGAGPAPCRDRTRSHRRQTELFVDANGAYSRKQALYFAELFADKDKSLGLKSR